MFVWDLVFLFLIPVLLLFPFVPFLSSAFLSVSYIFFSFLLLLCFLVSFSRKHYLEPDKAQTLSGGGFLLVPHPRCIGTPEILHSPWAGGPCLDLETPGPTSTGFPTAQMLTAKLRFLPLLFTLY